MFLTTLLSIGQLEVRDHIVKSAAHYVVNRVRPVAKPFLFALRRDVLDVVCDMIRGCLLFWRAE